MVSPLQRAIVSLGPGGVAGVPCWLRTGRCATYCAPGSYATCLSKLRDEQEKATGWDPRWAMMDVLAR